MTKPATPAAKAVVTLRLDPDILAFLQTAAELESRTVSQQANFFLRVVMRVLLEEGTDDE